MGGEARIYTDLQGGMDEIDFMDVLDEGVFCGEIWGWSGRKLGVFYVISRIITHFGKKFVLGEEAVV